MSRVLPPRPDEMTEAQQAMYDGIVHGPRTPKGGRSPFIDDEGRLIGPFGIWNIAPNVGDAVQNVGVAVRYNTSLPARVREIAILAVGAAYRANFEWYAHAPLAAAVELVLLIGYYAMLCITLNAFDVDLPAGEEKPFG